MVMMLVTMLMVVAMLMMFMMTVLAVLFVMIMMFVCHSFAFFLAAKLRLFRCNRVAN